MKCVKGTLGLRERKLGLLYLSESEISDTAKQLVATSGASHSERTW